MKKHYANLCTIMATPSAHYQGFIKRWGRVPIKAGVARVASVENVFEPVVKCLQIKG